MFQTALINNIEFEIHPTYRPSAHAANKDINNADFAGNADRTNEYFDDENSVWWEVEV